MSTSADNALPEAGAGGTSVPIMAVSSSLLKVLPASTFSATASPSALACRKKRPPLAVSYQTVYILPAMSFGAVVVFGL